MLFFDVLQKAMILYYPIVVESCAYCTNIYLVYSIRVFVLIGIHSILVDIIA